jgi:division protein 1
MASSSSARDRPDRDKEKKRHPRAALDPLVAAAALDAGAGGPSRMEIVSRALLAPFTTHRRSDSNKILSDRACSLR